MAIAQWSIGWRIFDMPHLMLSVGLATVLGLAGCTNLFFQPHRIQVVTPDQFGLEYDGVYFDSSDGLRLYGWWLPAQGEAIGTVLVLHGNAENISTHIGSVYWLPKRGFNVFLPDYRGYGASEGRPSIVGVLSDIESVLSTLLARTDIDPGEVIIYGQSLGGSLAIYVTAHTPHRARIRALIVESAFSSYRDIAREKLAGFWLTWPLQYPLSWTVRDEYSPIRVIDSVSPIPLLVVHGGRDAIVPLHHGERLFEAATEPKELWINPEAGHIEIFRSESYRDRLVEYLKQRLCTPRGSEASVNAC